MTFKRVGLAVVVLLVSLLVVKYANHHLTVESDLALKRPNVHQLPTLADNDDDILTFIQITDLHISQFVNPSAYEELKQFCDMTMKTIKPRVVLASGDLTDSISSNHLSSGQNEAEWRMYWEVVAMCESNWPAQWLDLRGNHDTFNLDGYNSSQNYYRLLGGHRARDPGPYLVTVQSSQDTKYAFVAVDAVLAHGPKRVLNFIGQVNEDQVSKLEDFKKRIEHEHINGSIWFGHYPTSSMISASPHGFRNLAAGAVAYLSGHYHNVYGLINQMYARHKSGLLELELADWKSSRIFRVAVLDHVLFSFVDVQHGRWPVVVVTNPKPALTVQPSKEPYHSVLNSTHIRMLIYSPTSIRQCQVRIDDGPWTECHLSGTKQPLYTAQWKPDDYASGMHTIRVRVRDDDSGWKDHFEHQFSLDGSQVHFSFLARMALMLDCAPFFQILFSLAIISLVASFCAMRWRSGNAFAKTDCLFYPMIGYTLYLSLGPWIAGRVIGDRITLVFPWGFLFGLDFIAEYMTYALGFFHLVTFNIPLAIILSSAAHFRHRQISEHVETGSSDKASWVKDAPFAIFLLFHVPVCIQTYIAYGLVALVASPIRTWSVLGAVYLYNKAKNLTEHQLLAVSQARQKEHAE